MCVYGVHRNNIYFHLLYHHTPTKVHEWRKEMELFIPQNMSETFSSLRG